MTLRLGFLQFAPRRLDRDANYRTVEELSAPLTADLLVLPELFDTGYLFQGQDELHRVATPAPDGATLSFLWDLARRRSCHLAAGFAERAGDQVYNSAALVGPEGLVGLYRKVHLFSREKALFAPGDLGFPVFDIGCARVGLMICSDWLFPEAARTLSLHGAQILAHPSNLVLPWCQGAMTTRALENGLFVVTANRIGSEELDGCRLTFTGRSQITGPRGEVLLSGPEKEPAAWIQPVDPLRADDKALSPENDLFADRRPEAYDI